MVALSLIRALIDVVKSLFSFGFMFMIQPLVTNDAPKLIYEIRTDAAIYVGSVLKSIDDICFSFF